MEVFIQYKGKVVTIQHHACCGPREVREHWAEDVNGESNQADPI